MEWKLRTLNIIDDYNREALDIAIDYSLFTAKAFMGFCDKLGIRHIKSQRGKPMQNGYIERFNRTYREDVLDMHIFPL
jgi:putative transposase